MMHPKFLKLSALSEDCTIRAGLDGPEQLQKLLAAVGWSLLFSLCRDGSNEVQRWTSANGGRAIDMIIPVEKDTADRAPTHQGVGSSFVAREFLGVLEEIRLDAEEYPEAYVFLPNRWMLDVIAFYELNPKDRLAIVN